MVSSMSSAECYRKQHAFEMRYDACNSFSSVMVVGAECREVEIYREARRKRRRGSLVRWTRTTQCLSSMRFFRSSTMVQWLFDSIPARLCDLDAVDLANLSATCRAGSSLRWPTEMTLRPVRGICVSARGASLLVKRVQRGADISSSQSWRTLSTRRGAAMVAGAVAAGRPDNRTRLAEAGLADVLVAVLDEVLMESSTSEEGDGVARAALLALRSLAGSVDMPSGMVCCCRDSSLRMELARLEIAKSLFELGVPARCASVLVGECFGVETRLEALRLAAALCGDFCDLSDEDYGGNKIVSLSSSRESDYRAMRDAFPRKLFGPAIDEGFAKAVLDVACDDSKTLKERHLALATLSSLAGHTFSPELSASTLELLGSSRTIDMCASFLPWEDDSNEEQRAVSEDAFDLLLSLLVTAIPTDGGEAVTRTRAARMQRAPGAIENIVHHVRTGRRRRFNDDDANLTVANVAVCLLADIFQVNPMSCIDPDVDDALVDHPRSLDVLAKAVPDLLKTLDDPPFYDDDVDDKTSARLAYWSAGDSCPGGEVVNVLRVLARRGFASAIREAGAIPVLEDMDAFCLAHPKLSLNERRGATYTWNSHEVRLLLVDLLSDLLRNSPHAVDSLHPLLLSAIAAVNPNHNATLPQQTETASQTS